MTGREKNGPHPNPSPNLGGGEPAIFVGAARCGRPVPNATDDQFGAPLP